MITTFILGLWARFQKYIVIAGAVLAFLATVWSRGYQHAATKYKARNEKARQKFREKTDRIRAKQGQVKTPDDDDFYTRMDKGDF